MYGTQRTRILESVRVDHTKHRVHRRYTVHWHLKLKFFEILDKGIVQVKESLPEAAPPPAYVYDWVTRFVKNEMNAYEKCQQLVVSRQMPRGSIDMLQGVSLDSEKAASDNEGAEVILPDKSTEDLFLGPSTSPSN